jgi:phosphoribosylformylglycinamidine cyclo-ligase
VVVPAHAAAACAATLRDLGEQVHVVGEIQSRGNGPAVVLR